MRQMLFMKNTGRERERTQQGLAVISDSAQAVVEEDAVFSTDACISALSVNGSCPSACPDR